MGLAASMKELEDWVPALEIVLFHEGVVVRLQGVSAWTTGVCAAGVHKVPRNPLAE